MMVLMVIKFNPLATVNLLLIVSLMLSFILGLSGSTEDAHVWLTVSSRVHRPNLFSRSFIQRELELNWNGIPIKPATWIGLFNHPPPDNQTGKVNKEDAVYIVDDLETSEGNRRSNIQFPIFMFVETIPLVSGCLQFYIVWVEDDHIKEVNCIRSQPYWMGENVQKLNDIPLNSLMIPGTHNSGSYSVGYEPGLLTKLLNAYSLCQDENVFNQLVYGNRYLDIRVMYDPKLGEDFWIAHDFYPINKTVRQVLRQVKQFMDSTSDEVVIMDFHRFPVGFEDKGILNYTRHNQLLDLIESIVGPHLTDNSDASDYRKTLGSIIATRRRLVLGYSEYAAMGRSYLFPAVKQLWANTDSIQTLSSYFNSSLCSYSLSASAAMAELTPNAMKVFNYGGLRKMAQSVNYLVTRWFRDSWYNRCTNIIASDYFLGNNVIEIAINSNKRRSSSATN